MKKFIKHILSWFTIRKDDYLSEDDESVVMQDSYSKAKEIVKEERNKMKKSKNKLDNSLKKMFDNLPTTLF